MEFESPVDKILFDSKVLEEGVKLIQGQENPEVKAQAVKDWYNKEVKKDVGKSL